MARPKIFNNGDRSIGVRIDNNDWHEIQNVRAKMPWLCHSISEYVRRCLHRCLRKDLVIAQFDENGYIFKDQKEV